MSCDVNSDGKEWEKIKQNCQKGIDSVKNNAPDAKIKELCSNPKKGKKLKHSDFYRLRIGEYRVIYELDIHEEQVTILYIGHRKNVYDDFSRLI